MKIALSLLLGVVLLSTVAYAQDAGLDAGVVDAGVSVAVDAGRAVVDAGPVAAALPSPDDPSGFITAVVDATHGGSWRVLSALVIVALVWATRKWGQKYVPWFATRWGGFVLAASYGILAQFATQLQGHATLDIRFVINGFTQGILASGVWGLIKDTSKPATPPSA